MKAKKAFSLLILFLILFSFSLPNSLALSKMFVSVSVNHYSSESTELIIISGAVSNTAGYPVQNALISIQVNNPNGSAIHVALVYSSKNGSFKDEFSLSPEAVEGNYTIYVIATKAGYEDFQTKISLTLFFSDFLIAVSPAVIELKRGELQQALITLISSKPLNFTVLLQVSGLPKGVKYSLNQTFVTPFKASMLTLEASKEADEGNYNVTVIGVGKGKIRYATISLTIVNKNNLNSTLPLTVFFISVLTSVIFSIFWRKMRKGKKSIFDQKYLAYARALAKLEELKAQGKISDEEYEKLREEYEEKLKRESL
ncbi:MAG: hypothetical protein QXZ53_02270 [Candidatus Bathyarchaeia archaeon]